MTHGTGVLDTTALILIERLDSDELPELPMITAVTLAELSVGPLVSDDPAEVAARQVRLQEVESAFDPLPFDTTAARAFGTIASELRHSGRKASARAFDAMIAATALANGLPLFTCNIADFAGINSVHVVELSHPDGGRSR